MIPNGYLMFEDENFIESSVAKLNALRKSGQFCDVRLQVCGHEMLAHRAVLACCSPYLFEIFNSDSDLTEFLMLSLMISIRKLLKSC